MRTITNTALSILRLALVAGIFLGPFGVLAMHKAELGATSGKIGVVLLMSMKRSNLG